MLTSLVLATALAAQVPRFADRDSRGFGGSPVHLSPAQRRFVKQPFDPRRTRDAKHNVRARRYEELRLTPLEAVQFMKSHPEIYRRR